MDKKKNNYIHTGVLKVKMNHDVNSETQFVMLENFTIELKNGKTINFSFEENEGVIDKVNNALINYSSKVIDNEIYPEAKKLTIQFLQENFKKLKELSFYIYEKTNSNLEVVTCKDIKLMDNEGEVFEIGNFNENITYLSE